MHRLAWFRPAHCLNLALAAGDLALGVAGKQNHPITRYRRATFDDELDIPIAQPALTDATGGVALGYWAARYAPMRRNIIPHAFHIDAANAGCLEGLDFVFLCVDRGDVKGPIIEKLEELEIPFIDVGMGLELVDDALVGVIRVTASTPDKRDHVRGRKRIGLTGGDADGVYHHNIQVADLNALNAALAVIKWKKLAGFYKDLENEHYSTYTIDGNIIINEDQT